MGKIYTAGVLPAATFGSAIVWVSNGELREGQRVLLSYKPPRHKGCSLRAKLAILGDPMWRPAVAPVLQWAA
eukprot:3346986-Pyramimonas_sp.AAC.1